MKIKIPYNDNTVDVSVMVKNKPVVEYIDNYTTWIEGRDASEYSIRLKNNNNEPMKVVLSIDGLNVLNGKPASADGDGIVIQPFDIVNLKGWMVDNNTGAAFTFGSSENSYAAKSGYGINTGVIGIALYVGRNIINPNTSIEDYFLPISYPNAPIKYPKYPRGSDKYRIRPLEAYYEHYHNHISLSASSVSDNDTKTKGLGTEFGKKINQKMTETVFEGASFISTSVIRYAEMKELIKRGIVKPASKYVEPSPFPASFAGCAPPLGWSGY